MEYNSIVIFSSYYLSNAQQSACNKGSMEYNSTVIFSSYYLSNAQHAIKAAWSTIVL